MHAHLHADLLEATRLTRAGQLLEATALIQRALNGGVASQPSREPGSAPPARVPLTFDGIAERIAESVADAPAWSRSALGNEPELATPAAVPMPGGLIDLLQRLPRELPAAGFRVPSSWRAPSPLPLRVPVPVPEGARFETTSYTNAAGTREYKLYVPSSYRGGPAPLVVMLHGCTQDPDDFAAGTRMNEHAETHGCLVVYPAQAVEANPTRCWNWFRVSDQARDQGEPSLIVGITRQVMADYAVDPRRVYLAGMSAGGAMATVMAATHPDLYAAVGVHSGLAHGAAHDLPSALAAMRQATAAGSASSDGAAVPTIVFHGDQDAVVHADNGERIVEDAVGRAGADREPEARSTAGSDEPGGRRHTRTTYRDARGRAMVEHWVIHGAGHAWSGGSQSGSYSDPNGPDASAEMLRFFFEHARVLD
jgi:poly(hydroxyalkanoate) depolymerase family esterase